MIKDWNFWFSVVTAIVAIIALVQTYRQTKLSNKQHLFDKRLEDYMIAKGLITLYSDNRTLLEIERKDEPIFDISCEFVYLTNNSYMEKMADVMKNPLKNPEHELFLSKREELRKIAIEIRLIFSGGEAVVLSDFVSCYEIALQRMYQYQILLNNMSEAEQKNKMTLEQSQNCFDEEQLRLQLLDAYDKLKQVYAIIEEEKIEEKIIKQIRLK